MSLHILAIETSGNRCGVALLREDNGRTEVFERAHDGVAEHSARLLPMVQAVLAEAGIDQRTLDAVAFGQGPGGFTGLRVACGVAQGLGFALDIPVLGIGSHQAVEFRLPAHPALRLIALDARMQEAYVAVFRRGEALETVREPVLLSIDLLGHWAAANLAAWQAPGADGGLVMAGDIFASDPAGFATLTGVTLMREVIRPDADAVAHLALADWRRGARPDAATACPLYVRDKVAFTIRERAAGAGGNPRAGEPA